MSAPPPQQDLAGYYSCGHLVESQKGNIVSQGRKVFGKNMIEYRLTFPDFTSRAKAEGDRFETERSKYKK